MPQPNNVFCSFRGKHIVRADSVYALYDSGVTCDVCGVYYSSDDTGFKWMIEMKDGTQLDFGAETAQGQ